MNVTEIECPHCRNPIPDEPVGYGLDQLDMRPTKNIKMYCCPVCSKYFTIGADGGYSNLS